MLTTLPQAFANAAVSDDCPMPPSAPTEQQVRDGMANARDRGVLWKLERDGRVSWLYGTIHVGRAEWIYPGPSILGALVDSQTIALELDITDPKVAQALSQLPPGTAMPTLSASQRRRMQIQAAAACLPVDQLSGLHPVLQVAELTASMNRRQGLDPMWAQEVVLAGLGRSMGKPIASLETPATQMAALLPTDPAEAQRQINDGLDQMEDGRASRLLNRLVRDWEAGNLADIANYAQWCECLEDEADKVAMRKLLDDRNPAIADGIARLHEQGSVFAAVGAMHMTGSQALPALLQRRGFSVTPVLPRANTSTTTSAPASAATSTARTAPVPRIPASAP